MVRVGILSQLWGENGGKEVTKLVVAFNAGGRFEYDWNEHTYEIKEGLLKVYRGYLTPMLVVPIQNVFYLAVEEEKEDTDD